MTAVNDTQKKITVHTPDVLNVNGTNIYVDDNGTVVGTEKRKDKKKLFARAGDKVRAQTPSEQNVDMADLIAQHKQYD